MKDALVVAADGPPITSRGARDLIGEARGARARTVVVPVGRLEPGFFDLATGIAGDIVQAFVNYRLRLVIAGELPEAARSSRSFAAFVLEANRGDQLRFVATLDEAGRPEDEPRT